MRADRLVAILLMLQRQGQVTAAQVAEELEISERTARRDLEALGSAGLPVYSSPGRGGGWRLLGGGRTDLSGFSAAEARALFMIAGSAPATTPELQSALRKLMRALPESFRDDADQASTMLILEPTGWSSEPVVAPPLLAELQAAVIGARQIDLGYADRRGEPSVRRIHPLGLVNKGRRWYVVADTTAGLRTFRVDRVVSVETTSSPVDRPEGFDLAEAWSHVGSHVRSLRPSITAVGIVAPALAGVLHYQFSHRVEFGAPNADGWLAFEVQGSGVEEVAGRLAALGASVLVAGPPEVVVQLAKLGAELSALYDPAASPATTETNSTTASMMRSWS